MIWKLDYHTEFFLRIWNYLTEAGEEFRFVIENDEENADAHYNLGFLYAVSTDQKEDALNHLKTSIYD